MTDAELQACGAIPMPRTLYEELSSRVRRSMPPILAVPWDQPHGYVEAGREFVVVRGPTPETLEGITVDAAWLRRCWPDLKAIGFWFACTCCGGHEAVPTGLRTDEAAARAMVFQERHAPCQAHLDGVLAALGYRIEVSEETHVFLLPLPESPS